jgi:hypothetical protein
MDLFWNTARSVIACSFRYLSAGRRVHQIFFDFQRRHAAKTRRRHRLAIDFVGDIARREDAGDVGAGGSGLDGDVAGGF